MMLDTAIKVLIVASLVPGLVDSFRVGPSTTATARPSCRSEGSNRQCRAGPARKTALASSSSVESATALADRLQRAFDPCRSEIAKTCRVALQPTSNRLGLVATAPVKKGEAFLAVPYDDRIQLTADIARDTVFQNVLAESYEGWTGDAGLIALLVLNELARADDAGIQLPQRPKILQNFVQAWIQSLPSPQELADAHPLLWTEEDQEILQASSTNKIYQALDDLEEDATWLIDNVFSKDRDTFPEEVTWNGSTVPCFSVKGYAWAMAIAKSRSVFVDGTLRILPIMDYCNHSDEAEEVVGGTMGRFGTVKGAKIIAHKDYAVGDEVFCSYGPKSAADYLLEHGFCPPQCFKTAVSELTFEISQDDRFYDDKLDILEFETYDQAPMDPVQKFDVVSAPGRDGEPDPALMQFVRLAKLGGTDAFLLESIFRKEVWGFMSLPVSERNELDVVNAISEACQKALDDMAQCKEGGPEVCTQLRQSESKALTRTLEFLRREKEALDLKEYYQERRLKDLGLDSEWSPEDDMMGDDDLSFGQTRAPGGADYDW